MCNQVVSRRNMLKGLGLATVSAVAASCAPKTVTVKETVIVEGTPQIIERVVTATPEPTPVAPQPEGPKVVRWWQGWFGRWVELGNEIAQTDEFKEMLPGVTFEPYGANSEKLLTAIAGGDPPGRLLPSGLL